MIRKVGDKIHYCIGVIIYSTVHISDNTAHAAIDGIDNNCTGIGIVTIDETTIIWK